MLLAPIVAARASPPPDGSADARDLRPYSRWFEAQASTLGLCCSLADGRTVDARIHDGHYEVRFLHPESIRTMPRPRPGTYYRVPAQAVVRSTNPTGRPIAWWSPREIYVDGASIGHIRCFVEPDLY